MSFVWNGIFQRLRLSYMWVSLAKNGRMIEKMSEIHLLTEVVDKIVGKLFLSESNARINWRA